MPKLRHLLARRSSVVVLLPARGTAQDRRGASPAPGTTATSGDSAPVQLEQLMPSTLAGLPSTTTSSSRPAKSSSA